MKDARNNVGAIDPLKLTDVRQGDHKITAACPACREQGHDKNGDHLVVYPGGKFSCIKSDEKTHLQRIYQIAGTRRDGPNPRSNTAPIHKSLGRQEWSDLGNMSQRVRDLIERQKDTILPAEEKSELDHYLEVAHIMRLAKARARQLPAQGQ